MENNFNQQREALLYVMSGKATREMKMTPTALNVKKITSSGLLIAMVGKPNGTKM